MKAGSRGRLPGTARVGKGEVRAEPECGAEMTHSTEPEPWGRLFHPSSMEAVSTGITD